MNIVHSKGTMKLIRLNPIDQLMNKYEGQYTGKIILLENKSIYDAQVNELDRLIRKEIHKTKEEERWKKSDKLNTVYNNFIKELDKKTNDLDKKLEEFKGYE
tara:strand:+ start:593 stop:898 length:306 start_codon:yes stop_codon:yes gene_type:complete